MHAARGLGVLLALGAQLRRMPLLDGAHLLLRLLLLRVDSLCAQRSSEARSSEVSSECSRLAARASTACASSVSQSTATSTHSMRVSHHLRRRRRLCHPVMVAAAEKEVEMAVEMVMAKAVAMVASPTEVG